MKVWLAAGWGLAAFAAFMVLFVLAQPAKAQEACGPLPDLLSRLVDRFKEFIVFEGATAEGQILVTKNDDGDFTIIQVRGGEAGCIIAVGKNAAFNNGI